MSAIRDDQQWAEKCRRAEEFNRQQRMIADLERAAIEELRDEYLAKRPIRSL